MMKNEQNERSNLQEVLERYKGEVLPTLINSKGDNLIKPTYRRVMKRQIEEALKQDLMNLIDDEVAEMVSTYDGLMMVAGNDNEGCYTVEIQVKVKNLDYDAYELMELDDK